MLPTLKITGYVQLPTMQDNIPADHSPYCWGASYESISAILLLSLGVTKID